MIIIIPFHRPVKAVKLYHYFAQSPYKSHKGAAGVVVVLPKRCLY